LAPDRPQPVRDPRRARCSWERPSCHGVSGQVLPRARPRRTALEAPIRHRRCRFAAAFPVCSQPCFSRPRLCGRAGLLQRLRNLLLLLLRSFLGFSLLRHHKPPSKVKEASTAPVQLRRAIQPSGAARR
jgi:hypothetical protein